MTLANGTRVQVKPNSKAYRPIAAETGTVIGVDFGGYYYIQLDSLNRGYNLFVPSRAGMMRNCATVHRNSFNLFTPIDVGDLEDDL